MVSNSPAKNKLKKFLARTLFILPEWVYIGIMVKTSKLPAFLALLAFIVLLPIVLKIDFMQNDDWVYVRNVRNFLTGNFTLDPLTAPTFYLQGIFGGGFSLLFGTERLPVLTLVVTCIALYLFLKICESYIAGDGKYGKAFMLAACMLLFIFNPLITYSVLGFMSENYFLMFALIAFYFFIKSQPLVWKKLILANSFVVAAFFVRQVAFVLPLAFTVSLVIDKQYKKALIELLFFGGLYVFYLLGFPQTPEMYEKPLEFKHLLDYQYVFALSYGILIYLFAFTIPVAGSVLVRYLPKKPLAIVLVAIASAAIYVFMQSHFHPSRLSWGEFPYLDNTFERTGFFSRGILGTKYQFYFIYDLYLYWDIAAKVFIALFVPAFLIGLYKCNPYKYKKQLLHPALVYVVIYFALMVVTQKVYDRYLTGILPFFLIYLISQLKKVVLVDKLIWLVFGAGLTFFSLQFALDFVVTNSYVWHKSVELAKVSSLPRESIQGTNAWKLINRNDTRHYVYDFSFDSRRVNEKYLEDYELIEEKLLTYPGSMFIQPKIYLYKRVKPYD